MKPINEVYDPKAEYGWSDYQPMLDSMGYEIIAQAELGSYQGDTIAVVRDGSRYGFLTFGWGSCSQCDSLQGCSTLHEVDELRREIHDQIVWKDSRQEMLDFVENRDWDAQYYGSDPDLAEFVNKTATILRSA